MNEANGHTATRAEILDYYTELILFLDVGFASLIPGHEDGWRHEWKRPFIREQLAALVERCCHERD